LFSRMRHPNPHPISERRLRPKQIEPRAE
jgi:hypothetical protein